MLEVNTPLGTIVAKSDPYPNCPGVSIYIRRGEQDALLLRLECDENEEELAFYAWFDPNRYKHSHSGVLSEDGIEKMLEED